MSHSAPTLYAMNRATHYAKLAAQNLLAARAVDKSPLGSLPGYSVAALAPIMSLTAQAIELALKSYLLQPSVPEGDVKKLGHDLKKLGDRAKDVGAALAPEDDKVLAAISDLHASNTLRYGEQIKFGRSPAYGPLETLAEKCLKQCDAPTLSEMLHD